MDPNNTGTHEVIFWDNLYNPYEKYLYQSIGAIYVPYMSPIISIGEL